MVVSRVLLVVYSVHDACMPSVRPWMEAKRSPSSYVFDLLQFTHVACGL